MNASVQLPVPALDCRAHCADGAAVLSPGSGEARHAGIPPVNLLQPGRIRFGSGCSLALAEDLIERDLRKPFFVVDPAVQEQCVALLERLQADGIEPVVYDGIQREPTISSFKECLRDAGNARPDAVIGLGGGSVMDVAKLVAALLNGEQTIESVFGINALRSRRFFLACIPTTAGTGSEVSPNAILLDESCWLKKGVISPHLVPDVACVDPLLTHSVPPPATAATGLDALTHCLEAYANKFAHPIVDLYALEGIRLISRSLLRATANGQDAAARERLALGSLYGGLCLGSVNTGAVHALAYPLGSRYHVSHGLSVAVLLPHVLRFNLKAAPERYADVALALGVPAAGSNEQTAEAGVRHIEQLMAECAVPRRLSDLGVPENALSDMASEAMTVTRLLKNNPRPVTNADALEVYHAAW